MGLNCNQSGKKLQLLATGGQALARLDAACHPRGMDEQIRRKLQEVEEQARQLAVDEVMALKNRHNPTKGGSSKYEFEYEGKTILAAFVTGSNLHSPANSYQIELLSLPDVVVAGQCFITDTKGRRLGATAITKRGAKENRIIITSLALP